jgi:hypothetical protein
MARPPPAAMAKALGEPDMFALPGASDPVACAAPTKLERMA